MLRIDHVSLRILKNTIETASLKVLQRKWDCVQKILTKQEIYEANLERVGQLHQEGRTVKEIKLITGLSHTHVHRLIKRSTYIDPEEIA